MPTPTATALVFGSAFHATIEEAIKVMADGKDVDLPMLWATKWDQKVAQEGAIDWGDETPADLHELGTRMLGKLDVSGSGANRKEMASEFLSKIVPLMNNGKPAIERKISLSVPGVPIPVIGYIDIITADGVPSDFKTASRA